MSTSAIIGERKSIGALSLARRLAGESLSIAGLASLSRWAVLAALAEFLLLRVLIRMGPMLPQQPEVIQGARAILLLGTVALNAAAILSTLGLLVVASLSHSATLRGLMIAAVVLGLARLLAQGSDVVFLLYSGVMLAVMLTTLVRVPSTLWRRGLLLVLLALYGALAYPMLVASAGRLGWRLPQATGLFFVAEGLAVGVPIMAHLAFQPGWRRGSTLAALAVTGFLGTGMMARPWLVWTLAQWTVSFTGFLPFWLYLMTCFFFVYTVFGLVRTRRFLTWGLILVALGGLRWDYTYLSGLSLFGFLLLATSWDCPEPGGKGQAG